MLKRSTFMGTAAASVLVWAAASPSAMAQAEPQPATEPQVAEDTVASIEDIVVTGSRVARSGFDAPTPTTVMSAEEINQRGLSQVGEFLTEVPSFRATQTPQSNPQSARGAGQFFADLRGLGSIRTLTLVNGRRHVPSSPDGQVDLNLIPSVLVGRVDVVTGGASAQWGSDAVAGVINVVLDTNLQGFKSDISYGITKYDDNEEYRASVAYGTRFADDRGRLVLGYEYVDAAGVLSHYDRPFGREIHELVSYSGARPAGEPSRFYAKGVTPLTMTWGGVILGPAAAAGQPLHGIQFGPGGTVLPFEYGTQIGTAAINNTGGQPGLSIRSGHSLVLPVERNVFMAAGDFKVNDSLTLFAEASWAKAGSNFHTAHARDTSPTALVIRRDNAFLPTAIADIMDANNIASFGLGREHKDFGTVNTSNFNTTQRITLGANGDLGNSGWSWDAYFQYGQNDFESRMDNLKINANLRNAADAIYQNGTIVCRSAAAQAEGCVPINLFGEGSPTQEAINYVTGLATYDVKTTQSVLAANINGEPVSTWAGPVSVAAGIERRVEESVAVVDAISQASGFSYGNPKNFEGEYTVHEAYAEAVIPLASGMAFADQVDANLAVRYADYSTSGGAWTWKAGLSWDVNEQLRLRGTRSRDIRAPNNSELFAQTSGQATLRNPFSGATQQMSVVNRSSPSLKPEEADTLTLGAVLSPNAIPGLRLSLDYFDIKIDGSIAAYSPQLILDNCASEASGGGAGGFFCSFVDRSGTGASTVINTVNAQLLNIAGYEARGFDFEAAYSFDFLGGDMGLRLVGTHTLDLISDDGLGNARTYNDQGVLTNVGSVVDRAGQVGGFNSSSVISATSAPEWSWSVSANYRRDRWSAMVQGRYVGGGLIDATLIGPDDAEYDPSSPISIGDNTIDSRFYVNLSGNYEINDRVELYGVVNNVADTQPPFPYTGAVGFYDKIGRTFKVGVRMTF